MMLSDMRKKENSRFSSVRPSVHRAIIHSEARVVARKINEERPKIGWLAGGESMSGV